MKMQGWLLSASCTQQPITDEVGLLLALARKEGGGARQCDLEMAFSPKYEGLREIEGVDDPLHDR